MDSSQNEKWFSLNASELGHNDGNDTILLDHQLISKIFSSGINREKKIEKGLSKSITINKRGKERLLL